MGSMMSMRGLSIAAILGLAVARTCCADPSVGSEVIRKSFGQVTAAIGTADVPTGFTVRGSMPIPGYAAFSVMIVQFDLRVSGRQVVVPFDAFAGLGDPTSVDVRETASRDAWRLTLVGGDASTSYCAVMEFDSVQIHVVTLSRSCSARVPFAVKRYAKLEILN